jgi:hypothetical protein
VTDPPTKVYSGPWRLERRPAERSSQGVPVWAVFTPATDPAFLWAEHVGEIETPSNLQDWLVDAGVERVYADLLTQLMMGWFEVG